MDSSGGADRDGFTDEAVEQRHTGNRKGSDHKAPERKRHLFSKTTQLVDSADASRINDRAGTHKEQRFIKDMAESMRCRAVQRHSCAQAYAGDHKADLTDDVVRKQTPHIIFHDRIAGSV